MEKHFSIPISFGGLQDEQDEQEFTHMTTLQKKQKGIPRKQNAFGVPIIQFADLELKFPSRYFILGESETGKSNLIQNIAKKYHKQFNLILFFGANEQEEIWLNQKYRKEMIDKEMLRKIWEVAKKSKKKMKILVILDDCLSEKFHNDPFWATFFSSSRHQGFSIFVSVQHCTAISPIIRNNCKKIFVLHANERTASQLYSLTSGKASFYDFKKIVAECKLGKCLMIDRDIDTKNELSFILVPQASKNFRIK